MTESPRRELFYAATTINGERKLLLGPFTDNAIATTSLHAARELANLHFSPPARLKVNVEPVPVKPGQRPATGELNGIIVDLGARLLV